MKTERPVGGRRSDGGREGEGEKDEGWIDFGEHLVGALLHTVTLP